MAASDVANFRENLKERCEKHGAVQKLANAASLSRVFISQILNGHSEPSFGVALDIARALGEDINQLVSPPQRIVERPRGNSRKKSVNHS